MWPGAPRRGLGYGSWTGIWLIEAISLWGYHGIWWYKLNIYIYNLNYVCTSSTAQGGGKSFKNRKPIGEVGCCESRMAERSHWWTERWLRSPLFLSLFLSLSLSFSLFLSLSLSFSLFPSLSLSFSLFLSLSLSFSDYLPTYRPTYLSIYLSLYLSLSLICLSNYLSIFRPSGAKNHWKNTVIRDFPTFSRTWIFFLLRLSLFLIFFLLLFSSLTLPTSAFHMSILSEVWLLNFLRLVTVWCIYVCIWWHLIMSIYICNKSLCNGPTSHESCHDFDPFF